MRDPGECPHPMKDRETDAAGRVWCGVCNVEIFEQPLQVGPLGDPDVGRLVPPAELVRRVMLKDREWAQEALKISQERHILRATVAQVRDAKCEWPGCQVPPMLRSRWCPVHKEEHRKENDRQRQQRKRDREGQKDTVGGGGNSRNCARVMKGSLDE